MDYWNGFGIASRVGLKALRQRSATSTHRSEEVNGSSSAANSTFAAHQLQAASIYCLDPRALQWLCHTTQRLAATRYHYYLDKLFFHIQIGGI